MTATIDGIVIDQARVEYAADLERRLGNVRAELDQHQQMLAQAQRDRTAANDRTVEARRELEQFRQKVWDAIAQEADDRGWCSEASDFLENLGLPRLERQWVVSVPVVGSILVSVTARSESDAREQAAEDWTHYADDLDNLETDGYSSGWYVEEVDQ